MIRKRESRMYGLLRSYIARKRRAKKRKDLQSQAIREKI